LRLKIDLHVHTVHSDGHGTVEEVLEAAKTKGLDGLAITDHDTLDGYFEARSLDNDLLVLPGFEVNTDAGHVLVLGQERLPAMVGEQVRYESIIKWSRKFDGLTVIAHPAAGKVKLERWEKCKPDAVEGLNALYPFSKYFVNKGLRIASRLGVPCVGGSDAHDPKNVGDGYTIVEVGNPSGENPLDAIRNGNVKFQGKLSPLSMRLKTGLGYMISALL